MDRSPAVQLAVPPVSAEQAQRFLRRLRVIVDADREARGARFWAPRLGLVGGDLKQVLAAYEAHEASE